MPRETKREGDNSDADQSAAKVAKTGSYTIDDADWKSSCEEAFLLALPPIWEYQLCRPGQRPGASSLFPSAESAELNAMLRRDQKKGTVKFDGNEYTVDFTVMVGVPSDRSHGLRKIKMTPQKVNVDKAKLKAMYLTYAAKIPGFDDGAGCDGISEDGFLRFFADIEVDPATDIAALGFSAACNASVMGVCRRREFLCGCAKLQVDTIAGLRSKMVDVRKTISSGKTLQEVYSYTFGIAIEPPSKNLPIEEAQQYWSLLLPNWPLREAFCTWAETHMKNKNINRDLWMQILQFSQLPADLATFDDCVSWPLVLDEFVEDYRSKKTA